MTISNQPAIRINGITKSYRIYPTPTHLAGRAGLESGIQVV